MLKLLTKQLVERNPLSNRDVAAAVLQLISEQILPEIKADFLTALACKGETPEEISFFVHELRALSVESPIDAQTRSGEILDVVGTGGDHLNTFNISTTVALVAASAGVHVAKHGNRAVTSKSGSADVLEALGIRTNLSPEEAARSLREHQFVFLFAPGYHPAFKHIGSARKLCAERGQRTIFNFLGPLLNPARPSAMLVGTPRPELCEPMARVLQALGVRRAMVVSGSVPSATSEKTGHLDELSILGETFIAEFYQEHALSTSSLKPRHFPLQPATVADLTGGDRHENAEIVRRILRGTERGPKRDAVLLNAAAALFVASKVKSLTDGWDLAVELIDSGKSTAKLEELVKAGR